MNSTTRSQITMYGLLKGIWLHITSRRRKHLSALLVLMAATSLTEVVSIGAVLPFLSVLMAPEVAFQNVLLKPLITVLGLTSPSQLLRPLTIAFVLIALVSMLMRIALVFAQTKFGYAIGADFSFEVYRKTLFQPYYVHVARNSSEVIASIAIKAHSVVGTALLPLLTIISSGIILVAILITLFVIDPVVALALTAGLGAPYGLIAAMTKKRLNENSQRISHDSSQVIKTLQEGLGGIRDVLIDGSQTAFCKIYRDADVSLRRSQANIQIIGGVPRYVIEFLGIALISSMAYGLADRDGGITLTIPALGALAVGAQRLLPVLQQLYNSWTAIRGGRAPLQDVLNLLDQPLPTHAGESSSITLPYTRSISLNEVSFRYSPSTPWVIDRINLEIIKGSRIGIIGTTGSGKSTLLDIIMGLLDPTSGSMSIDGVPVKPHNCRDWQVHVAHVPQSIFLADASIAENIAFGIPLEKIDLARVRYAAEQAQISETIQSWALSYDTVVGERGVRLSGGQRQRIGIARALYKQADVIVFDEATSALDNDTEREVMSAIDHIAKDITIIIVAHRLTTLKGCSQVIQLTNGRIIRSGSYEDMIQSQKTN